MALIRNALNLILVLPLIAACGNAFAAELDFRGFYLPVRFTPAVADLNNDGWVEPLGTWSDGNGHLTPATPASLGLQSLFDNNRKHRDNRLADFNGDGHLDLISNVYSCWEDTNSMTQLHFNNGDGTFTEDLSFRAMNIRGQGENIVTADFDNDGDLDIFIPFYTFEFGPNEACKFNSPKNYLLQNDGTGHFTDVTDAAGVGMEDWNDRHLRVEGAQAVDFEGDGDLDLYVGSHFFFNNGNLTFTDRRAALGLPELFDEGAKFLDWNNDGHLDLVLHHPNSGPHLFAYDGSTFTEKLLTPAGHPFFSSGAPAYAPVGFTASYGMNV